MNDAAILETKHLTKRFGGLNAIQDLSIDIQEGEITSIIGPNGAGKTTLFNVLTGFLRPDEGECLFKGRNITGLAPYRITRMGMARTFQLIRVFPKLSAVDNILLGCQGLRGDNIVHAILKTKKSLHQFNRARERAVRILETVGLLQVADHLASEMSYGQQKLLEIGRVLASDPKVLLLDEPMAGLSMTMIDRMIQLIFELKEQGRTIVLVEHNMGVVMDISDSIIVLSFGRQIASGAPGEILKNPEVVDAYLGI